jgi:hyperosmotically inducible periplasmic protein
MRRLLVLVFVFAAMSMTVSAQRPREDRVTREVRHELLMLPRYGVFDHLAFKIDKGAVTLLGQVRTGILKSEAERVVKEVEGVESVVNQIELLPASTNDDRIRLEVYRAIYRHDALETRYAIQSIPPIHIIVKNGQVTLEGVVDSQLDKTIASTQARSVPGIFKVTDNLRVESGS